MSTGLTGADSFREKSLGKLHKTPSAFIKSSLYMINETSPLLSDTKSEISLERLILVSFDELGESLKLASCRDTIFESCFILSQIEVDENEIEDSINDIYTDGITGLFIESTITNFYIAGVKNKFFGEALQSKSLLWS